MKKVFVLLLIIFSVAFVNVVKAEVMDFGDQEEVFFAKDGDYICSLEHYYYGTYVYDYNSDKTVNYVGRFDGVWYTDNPEIINVPNSNSNHCTKIDKNEFYAESPNGIPKTDTFLVYKESQYYGKLSVIPYEVPEVSITCDKSSLKYGETSACKLTYKANSKIIISGEYSGQYNDFYNEEATTEVDCFEKASFSFNDENFKVTKYDSDYDVTEKDGTFNLVKNDDVTCVAGKDNVLLEFTVTPASPEVAGALLNISADNFVSTDSFTTNKSNPATNLAVVKEEKNPKTGSTIALCLLIVAFCASVILFIIGAKKNVFRKI